MNSVVLHTKLVLHQKTYTYDVKLTVAELGLSADGWAWAAWVHAAKESQVSRLGSQQIFPAIRAFKLMRDADAALDLFNHPVNGLQLSLVCQCYESLEAQLVALNKGLSDNSKHRASLRTRALLNRFLEAVGYQFIHRIQSAFKTSLPLVRKGRALISDDPMMFGGEVLEPVGAISHSSAEDLRKKTARILISPLEKIAEACIGQLDQQDKLDAWKLEMLRREPDSSVLEKLLSTTHKPRGEPLEVWSKEIPIYTLAVAYLHLLYNQLPKKGVATPQYILRSSEIDAIIEKEIGCKLNGMRLISPAPRAGQTLVACLMMLQIHSHWNVNSVLELTLRSLSSLEPPLEMQSFKSRTKTETPIVSLDRGEPAARALRFLINRLDSLKKMMLIDNYEQRLWLNPSGKPYVGWGTMLRLFREKWGLPKFSFEQIRLQSLAAQSVQVGGLALTKGSAGHVSLTTTSLYLDKLLLRRLNSSANLEFQRRLEADVRTVISGGEARYLYPIGDGASCVNPYEPPFESDTGGGACKGERCHVGDGCPNRRIVINGNRVEEIVRTAAYYRENWVRLYERNPEAFDAFHVPSMNFNFALLGMLRRGSYAHLIRAAELAFVKPQGSLNE